jgi:broad specificity phosphatase PhoE
MSGQPKTNETGAIIALRRGLHTAVDERFAEVDQSASGWIENYRETAVEYLRTGASPGWEPHESVVARFDAAIAAVNADGDVVIATHGLAPSLWLASRTAIDIVPFWEALTFPDAWRLDLDSGELAHLFSAGAPAPDL